MVKAEEWSAVVSEVVGGKSGGKESIRQGQGNKPENLEEAVEVAMSWFKSKLNL
jgi:alanyl-tRNA synthetase